MIPLFIAALSILANSHADAIYTCKMKADASISVEYGDAPERPKITADAHSTVKEETSVVLVTTKEGGMIKGNLSQVHLKRLSANVYEELTTAGNVVLWTLFPEKDKRPAYVVQQ